MSTVLRNELSNLSTLTALGFVLAGKNRAALGAGILALGLRALPAPRLSFRSLSVVITGGSRGLGLALAEQLIQEGAFVTLLARDQEELDQAVEHLDNFRGVPALGIICDVTDRHQLQVSFEKTQEHFGRIDILINNAGSVVAGPFESMSQSDFEAQMNLHFFAPLKAIQEIVPIFKHQGEGRIINISSIGGTIAIPHMSAYCASKFALSGFSQAVTPELSSSNIRMTTVYPGLMRTGSPIQGVFKGDSEREFAWFAILDSTPGFSISARSAAQKILDSVRRGDSQITVTLPAKFASFFHGNFPEIFTTLMNGANRLLPKGQSHKRRTGADSQSWLTKQFWAQPFVKIMHRAQSQYNEHEKSDAEFNLNLR